MIYLAMFLSLLSLIFLQFLELEKTNSGKKIIIAISFLALGRVFYTGFSVFLEIQIITLLLSFPIFIKYFYIQKFKKEKIEKKKIIQYFLPLILPEFYFFIAFEQWRLKKEINQISPENLSDTDEKLLLLANTFWAVSTIGVFFGSEVVLTSFLMSFLPSAAYMYFITGIEKARLHWGHANDLTFINKAAVKQLGWWETPKKILNMSSNFAFLVMFLEVASVILLFPLLPPAVFATLILLCLFHLMVFVTTGISFWKWVIANVAACIAIMSVFNFDNVVNENYVLWISPTLLFYLYYNYISTIPIRLGWYDSPISKCFKIYLIDENENEERVMPYHIFPFDTIMSQNRLEYLFSDNTFFTGCLGSTKDYQLLQGLKNLSNEEEDKDVIIDVVKNLINRIAQNNIVNREENSLKSNKLLRFILENKEKFYYSPFKVIFSHIQSIDKRSTHVSFANTKKIKITLERFFYSKKLEKHIQIQRNELIYTVNQNKKEK